VNLLSNQLLNIYVVMRSAGSSVLRSAGSSDADASLRHCLAGVFWIWRDERINF